MDQVIIECVFSYIKTQITGHTNRQIIFVKNIILLNLNNKCADKIKN